MMKKGKTKKDKKDMVIAILATCILVGGLLNIFKELRDLDEKNNSFYSSSYLSVPDFDFNEGYNIGYNSSYIKVELLKEQKQILVTPVKSGDTELKIKYKTTSGEDKSLSYSISVRKGLSLEIEDE